MNHCSAREVSGEVPPVMGGTNVHTPRPLHACALEDECMHPLKEEGEDRTARERGGRGWRE
jgi:hypothetical protein